MKYLAKSSCLSLLASFAVAVSQNGKPVVNRVYGSADLERDVPLSPNSILDIGSVRKQFPEAATHSS